jgi:hypothetical protein
MSRTHSQMNWIAAFLASISLATAQNVATGQRAEFEVASVKRKCERRSR